MAPPSTDAFRPFGASGKSGVVARISAISPSRLPYGITVDGAKQVVLSQPGSILSGLDLTGHTVMINADHCRVVGNLWDHSKGVGGAPLWPVRAAAGTTGSAVEYNTFIGSRGVDSTQAFFAAAGESGSVQATVRRNRIRHLSGDFLKMARIGDTLIEENYVYDYIVLPFGTRTYSQGLSVSAGDFLVRGEAVWEVLVDGVTTSETGLPLSPPPLGNDTPPSGYRYHNGKPHVDWMQQAGANGTTQTIRRNVTEFRSAPGYDAPEITSIWLRDNNNQEVAHFVDNVWECDEKILYPWRLQQTNAVAGHGIWEGNAVPFDTQGSGFLPYSNDYISRSSWSGNVQWNDRITASPGPDGMSEVLP